MYNLKKFLFVLQTYTRSEFFV